WDQIRRQIQLALPPILRRGPPILATTETPLHPNIARPEIQILRPQRRRFPDPAPSPKQEQDERIVARHGLLGRRENQPLYRRREHIDAVACPCLADQ